MCMLRLADLVVLSVSLTASVSAQTRDELLARAQKLIQTDNLEEARVLLADGCQRDPVNVSLRYQLGYVLYRQRRLADAKSEFEAVVKLAPPALYSRYFLGRIALLENHPRQAAVWLDSPAHADPPVMDALPQLAKAYRDSGEFEKAAEILQSLIHRAPWDGALHYQLARVYQRLGQTALARDEFSTAERLEAADAADVQRLVELEQHLAKREKEPATRIYRELVSKPQADPDLLIALGIVLAGTGLESEALEPFRLAAEREPGFFQAQYNSGLTLLKLDRPAEAVGPLSEAAHLLPDSFDANSALALAYLAQGRHGDAIGPLQAARRLRPGDARVAGLLGSAYLRSGHTGEALTALRDAIAKNPKEAKLRFLVIEALQVNKDDEGALEAARETVRLFPRIPQAHLFLAQQLVRIGRYQDARPSFEKTSQLDPDNVMAKLGHADVLQRKGDAEGSLIVYRSVLALEPQNLAAQLGSAKALFLLNRYAEARDLLESALAEHSESATLHFELARVYARLGDHAHAEEHTRQFQKLREREPR
jgi:tetratricopeptide (TPR) repeat protein